MRGLLLYAVLTGMVPSFVGVGRIEGGFVSGQDTLTWIGVVFVLIVLAVVLLTMLYGIQYHTVRIYNWNGSRYRYLGRARLYADGGGYVVDIGERMADLSYTTLYQFCPSKAFVRRNRYKAVALRAGKTGCLLHVDTCMRQSVYYR